MVTPDSTPDTDELLERVLEEHGPALRRLVRSFEREPALQEDLMQEVALALWRSLPRFRGDASLKTFVFRIAHNRAVDHVARRARVSRVHRPLDAVTADPPSVDDGPDGALLRRERRHRLESAVADLPLGLRQAVVLRLEGMSHRQIAEVLGVSENAVAVRLHRAGRRLRDVRTQGTDVRRAPFDSAKGDQP